MNEKINRLKEIINNSDNILFFGGAGFPLKVVYETSEVVMAYIIKVINQLNIT